MSIGPWTFTGFDIVVLLVILMFCDCLYGDGFYVLRNCKKLARQGGRFS